MPSWDVSSCSTVWPLPVTRSAEERFPRRLGREGTEYRKLLRLYKERFKKWPDSDMREVLFKQAIQRIAGEKNVK